MWRVSDTTFVVRLTRSPQCVLLLYDNQVPRRYCPRTDSFGLTQTFSGPAFAEKHSGNKFSNTNLDLGSPRKLDIQPAAFAQQQEFRKSKSVIHGAGGKLAARNSEGSAVKRRPVGRVQSEANFHSRYASSSDLSQVNSPVVEKTRIDSGAVAGLINSANFISGKARSPVGPVSRQPSSSRYTQTQINSPSMSVSSLGNSSGPLALMLANLPQGKNYLAVRSQHSSFVQSSSGSNVAINASRTRQMSDQPIRHPPRKSVSLSSLSSKAGISNQLSKAHIRRTPMKNCSMGDLEVTNEHEVHMGPLLDSLSGSSTAPSLSHMSPGLLYTEDAGSSFIKTISPTGGCALSPLSNVSERPAVPSPPSSEESVSKLVKSKVKRVVSWIFGGIAGKVGSAENDLAKSEITPDPPILLLGEEGGSEGGILKSRSSQRYPSQTNHVLLNSNSAPQDTSVLRVRSSSGGSTLIRSVCPVAI
eukprot:gene5302-18547_t